MQTCVCVSQAGRKPAGNRSATRLKLPWHVETARTCRQPALSQIPLCYPGCRPGFRPGFWLSCGSATSSQHFWVESRSQTGSSYLELSRHVWVFNEASNDGLAVASAGHMHIICNSLRTDNHASTSPLNFFYRPDALPDAQPTVSKHWRQNFFWLYQLTWVILHKGPLNGLLLYREKNANSLFKAVTVTVYNIIKLISNFSLFKIPAIILPSSFLGILNFNNQ